MTTHEDAGPPLLPSRVTLPPPVSGDLSPARLAYEQRRMVARHGTWGSNRDVFARPVPSFRPPDNRRWMRRGRNANEALPRSGAWQPWWWRPPLLGPFETLVLLGVLRAGDNAFPSNVRDELESVTGEPWSLRATHTTFRRLTRKGYLHAVVPLQARYLGYFRDRAAALSALGLRALRRTLDTYATLRRTERGVDVLTSGTVQSLPPRNPGPHHPGGWRRRPLKRRWRR